MTRVIRRLDGHKEIIVSEMGYSLRGNSALDELGNKRRKIGNWTVILDTVRIKASFLQ